MVLCPFLAESWCEDERKMRGKSLDKGKKEGEKNGKEGMSKNGKHEMLVQKSDCSCVEHKI